MRGPVNAYLKCGLRFEEVLVCLVWTISTLSKAPAAAAVDLAAPVVQVASSHGFSSLWPCFGSSENYLDKTQPQGASSFLGVSFCLFCYKRGCRVTATDLRLQNLECGYSPLATTIEPPQIVSISETFSKKRTPYRGVSSFWYLARGSNPSKCRCPAGICAFPARRECLLTRRQPRSSNPAVRIIKP